MHWSVICLLHELLYLPPGSGIGYFIFGAIGQDIQIKYRYLNAKPPQERDYRINSAFETDHTGSARLWHMTLPINKQTCVKMQDLEWYTNV